MLTPDERIELRRLQEQAFGAERAGPLSPEGAERLRVLTAKTRADEHPVPVTDAVPADTVAAPATTRRLVRLPLVVGGAVLAVLLFAAGVVSSGWISTLVPPADLPEFSRPQTSEDLPGSAERFDLDPFSTRFVAILAGFQIYLARPSDGEGVCVVALSTTDNSLSSATCGTVVTRVSEGLSIVVGPTAGVDVEGTPARLSESVTAYLTQRS